MSAAANPYATFGGDVVSAPPPQPGAQGGDPYAAFGGSPGVPPPPQPAAPPPRLSIRAAPSLAQKLNHDTASQMWNDVRQSLDSESIDHPALAAIGHKMDALQEFLFGGQSVGKPMGTSGGVADLAGDLAAATAAPDMAEMGVEGLTQGGRALVDVFKGAPKTAEEASEAGNAVLKTRAADFKNQVVPGRAIVRESVDPETIQSANNARTAKDPVAERQHMEAIRDHLDQSIENLKQQQATLLQHPTGRGFDITPIIEESYQRALTSARETGSPEIVKAINKAHDEMLHIPNDDGEMIVNRYLNHEQEPTAEESQKVKQTFQGRSNYRSQGVGVDTPQQEANKFWKDVSAKVRVKLEEQVPGLGEVNSRLRDANAASKIAGRRIDTLRGMQPLPSTMRRFIDIAKPALVKGAAGAVGAGAVYDAYRKFLSGE